MCEHKTIQHIELRDGLSLQRLASWCVDCGALNDGTWRVPAELVAAKEALRAIRDSVCDKDCACCMGAAEAAKAIVGDSR